MVTETFAWFDVRLADGSDEQVLPVCLACAAKAADPIFSLTYCEAEADGLGLYCESCGEAISS